MNGDYMNYFRGALGANTGGMQAMQQMGAGQARPGFDPSRVSQMDLNRPGITTDGVGQAMSRNAGLMRRNQEYYNQNGQYLPARQGPSHASQLRGRWNESGGNVANVNRRGSDGQALIRNSDGNYSQGDIGLQAPQMQRQLQNRATNAYATGNVNRAPAPQAQPAQQTQPAQTGMQQIGQMLAPSAQRAAAPSGGATFAQPGSNERGAMMQLQNQPYQPSGGATYR